MRLRVKLAICSLAAVGVALGLTFYFREQHLDRERQRRRAKDAAIAECEAKPRKEADACLAPIYLEVSADAERAYANRASYPDLEPTERRMSDSEICSGVYRKTIDKSIGSLTIRESEAVATCRSFGLYRQRE